MTESPTEGTEMLRWNPRRHRLEGTYRNVPMERGVAYQFDLYDGGRIVTALWDGTQDHDQVPLFTEIDTGYRFAPRVATFFDTLENIAKAVAA
jgi:hypothetical protein